MKPEVPELERRTLSKVTRRLIPFLFVCYIVAYIDRVNIGFAASGLKADLRLTDQQFGTGAGLFFLGYFAFEIPSNLILQRVGARIWLARIMIVWGVVSMAMSFVQGVWSFYGLRLLLGLAEAGFFPGVVLYLTSWVPARVRARTSALFMMAAPLAMVVGGPLSGLLLKLEGWAGLHGWQWLFLLEGFPAVALGAVALRYLTDRPEEAAWLTPEERAWLSAEMEAERARKAHAAHASAWRTLGDPKVLLLCAIYFLNAAVTYGIFLWLPRMLEEVSGAAGVTLGLLNAAPFVVGIAAMILIGAHSDRTGERRGHVAACALTAALGLVLAAFLQSHALGFLLAFTLCQAGQRAIFNVFWSIPPAFLGGSAAAAGIALLNAIGNLGGFLGPDLMGRLRQWTGDFRGGLLCLAAAEVAVAALVLLVRVPREERRP